MNCQHCQFMVLLCMTYINLGLVIISLYGTFWSHTGLYYFRENETGFGQDNNIMLKILLFCSPFPIVLSSSFLYHSKLVDHSKLFILFQFIFSFFSVIYLFFENVKRCSKFPHCNATDRRCRARLYNITWITQIFIVDRHG